MSIRKISKRILSKPPFDFAPFDTEFRTKCRVEDRAVSLCFDFAQHPESIEGSNCRGFDLLERIQKELGGEKSKF